MKEQFLEIKKEAQEAIKRVKNQEELENFRNKFLIRKGRLNTLMKKIKDLSLEEKKRVGFLANQVKNQIKLLFEEKQKEIKNKNQSLADSFIGLTLFEGEEEIGKLNPLSQIQKEIEEIFSQMGFIIADAPEVENEWFNFTALNIPQNHPARDMQDTFWIKQTNKQEKDVNKRRILPRTQTSNAQIHYLLKSQPPFQIIAPGRVFRNEATDATHEHTFYQFEALVVGKKVTVANFKKIAKEFFSQFFKKKIEIRLRPSYFPFTEPSFEFDISCTVCKGKGCRSCKNSGWLEVGGAGMVNQKIFENTGYKRGQWQGFAWGFGLERLAMMKYQVNDIRLFKSGDLRFLRQF